MGYIILNTVTFDRVVAQNKVATVKYKLSTEPDANFVIKTASANISANGTTTGTFSPAVVIDGLITGESYTVETTLNCSGVGVRFTTSAGTPATTTTTTTAPPVTATRYEWTMTAQERTDNAGMYVRYNDSSGNPQNTPIDSVTSTAPDGSGNVTYTVCTSGMEPTFFDGEFGFEFEPTWAIVNTGSC